MISVESADVPSTADEALGDLLARELKEESFGVLPFWSHTPRADRPGPWVLSQWWPCRFEVDSIAYASAEHFMMAEKARLFGDEKTRSRVLAASHPGEAKNLGREVEGFDELTWEQCRFGIVVKGSMAKFSQNHELGAYLRSTAPRILVEASPTDRVWGVGLGAEDPRVGTPSQWRGKNLLGFALMEARSRL